MVNQEPKTRKRSIFMISGYRIESIKIRSIFWISDLKSKSGKAKFGIQIWIPDSYIWNMNPGNEFGLQVWESRIRNQENNVHILDFGSRIWAQLLSLYSRFLDPESTTGRASRKFHVFGYYRIQIDDDKNPIPHSRVRSGFGFTVPSQGSFCWYKFNQWIPILLIIFPGVKYTHSARATT